MDPKPNLPPSSSCSFLSHLCFLQTQTTSNCYTKRKKKDEENHSISHRLRKKSRTDSSSWTSHFSLSSFETSPDRWSGKEKAWLICLSAEAVLPPQRWPEEAWLQAKDVFLSSLGRQWNRHHSFSWNPPIHENIVTVGSAGDSRLNCDPSLALDQCEVCMIKHKAYEMWEYYQWKQSDTWAKDVNASVIQVALHHSWVNQGGKKGIRKIEILWSLLTEKRLICKDTAKAKFKRKRWFSLNKKPLYF